MYSVQKIFSKTMARFSIESMMLRGLYHNLYGRPYLADGRTPFRLAGWVGVSIPSIKPSWMAASQSWIGARQPPTLSWSDGLTRPCWRYFLLGGKKFKEPFRGCLRNLNDPVNSMKSKLVCYPTRMYNVAFNFHFESAHTIGLIHTVLLAKLFSTYIKSHPCIIYFYPPD